MSKNTITVRTKPGRIAYTAARGGKLIPVGGDGILVDRSNWIDRLIHVHGDIEIVAPKAAVKPATPKE